jgi:hypothetical protein
MERMPKDMSIVPSGDPDRDFAAMMIPHHQGAVDMARVELQFGKDPVLRRLARIEHYRKLLTRDMDETRRQMLHYSRHLRWCPNFALGGHTLQL